jgi:hypothetical protein
VKERCRTAAFDAYRLAALKLEPIVGVALQLSDWTNRAREAYASQWLNAERHPDAGWDWVEIFRRHNDPNRMAIVIWGPDDRLSGLGLVLASNRSVELRFLEGDPRSDCPLKGKRALIALEAAVAYGQAIGKTDIRVQPATPELTARYVDLYGFTQETLRGEKPFFRKPI